MKKNRWLINILSVAVTVACFAVIFSSINLQDTLSRFERCDKPLFFAMTAALFVPFTLLAVRWWMLVRGHGFKAPFSHVFLMNYAGIFFNNLLPGGVGGDLAKAFLAASGEDRKAAIVGTILLDRIVGLVAIVLMGTVCLTPYVREFDEQPIVPVLIYGMFGGLILAYLVYFNPTVRRLVGDRLPFRKTMGELDGVFRSAKERKSLMAGALGMALLSQAALILIVYGLARALGVDDVPLWKFFVLEPIIFVVTALPLSLGGLGIREGIYIVLFTKFAGTTDDEAFALSALFWLGMIVASVPGGVLFALGATAKRSPVAELDK